MLSQRGQDATKCQKLTLKASKVRQFNDSKFAENKIIKLKIIQKK